jgi:hypothetical protein
METENLPGQMEAGLLESIRMVKNMEKEFSISKMEELKT